MPGICYTWPSTSYLCICHLPHWADGESLHWIKALPASSSLSSYTNCTTTTKGQMNYQVTHKSCCCTMPKEQLTSIKYLLALGRTCLFGQNTFCNPERMRCSAVKASHPLAPLYSIWSTNKGDYDILFLSSFVTILLPFHDKVGMLIVPNRLTCKRRDPQWHQWETVGYLYGEHCRETINHCLHILNVTVTPQCLLSPLWCQSIKFTAVLSFPWYAESQLAEIYESKNSFS